MSSSNGSPVVISRVLFGLVYQGQARDVESVMVDGRWLMRDGKVLSMNEEEVIREADRVSREVWLRYFKDHPDLEMPEGFDCGFAG